MAFRRYKNYAGDDDLLDVVVNDSVTLGIGYPVYARDGVAKLAAAGTAVAGIVVDLLDKKGNSIFGSTLRELGGATITTDNPYGGVAVMGAANTTTDLIVARINTSKKVLYSASVTGTMNTTNTSNTLGGWVDGIATTGLNVDETTHTRTITSGGQYKNWGVDPNDSTRMIVSINESEVWDNATTMA